MKEPNEQPATLARRSVQSDGSAAASVPQMTLVKTELKQDDKAVFATVTVRDQDGIEYRFVGGCFYIFLQRAPPNSDSTPQKP